MACKGFIQLLLKVINVVFTLVGLAMIGYGIYMFVMYNNSSSSPSPPPPPPPSPPPPSPPPPSLSPPPPPPSPPPPSASPPPPSPSPPPPSPPPPSPPPPSEVNFVIYQTPPMLTSEGNIEDGQMDIGNSVLQLRRTLLEKSYKDEFSTLSSFWSRIPTAWFLYLFIVVGVVITLITCSGYIAAATANGCCLSCYSVFVGLFMILELALAAFIFFDNNWQDVIPEDSTGELDSIEDFIEDRIDILKWVALAAMILQAFALLLAVILRAISSRPGKDYDSDDEYLAARSSRQPLLNRQATSGTSASTVGSENRSARTDAWSTRMREKYGLDTTEFSYNPESKRFSQQPPSVEENKGCCTIM